ncbi:MAG: creatininase family protein [Longimicrobiales bacterium]
MKSYALDELTWPEIRSHLDGAPRLMMAVGALEQHGPHLPLGANVLVAHRVVEEVSQRLGILRAPTFSYGVTASRGPRAGSAGLRRKTLHRAVNELVAQWEDQGVEEFILVTAHRYEPHLEALLMVLSTESRTTVYDLFQIDVADLLEGDPELEHAGEMETSLLLHLAPDRVRASKMEDYVAQPGLIRRYTRGRMPTPPGARKGVVGRPSLAAGDTGARIFARYTDILTEALRRPPELRD